MAKKRKTREELDTLLDDLSASEGDAEAWRPAIEEIDRTEEVIETVRAVLDDDPIPDPKPVEARVAMRVYLAACGFKWDQMAGFKNYATTRKMGPLSMKEWNEAYQNYLNRPVG